MRPINAIRLDWLSALLPASCVGSYGSRLVVDATAPLALLSLGCVLAGLFAPPPLRGSVLPPADQGGDERDGLADVQPRRLAWLGAALVEGTVRAAPWALFCCFAFAPSVASRIFSAFACDSFAYDSTTNW